MVRGTRNGLKVLRVKVSVNRIKVVRRKVRGKVRGRVMVVGMSRLMRSCCFFVAMMSCG